MIWEVDFEDIAEINKEDGGRVTVLDQLIKRCAVCPEFLVDGLRMLHEVSAESSVLCFCQLPFFINVSKEPYELARRSTNGLTLKVRLYFRYFTVNLDPPNFEPKLEAVSDIVEFRSADNKKPIFTQVIAVIPLWFPRLTYYPRYIRYIEAGLRSEVNFISAEESWKEREGRPVPIGINLFEYDLAQRMIIEFRPTIQNFLRHYTVISLSETPVPEKLFGYFLMTSAGRIAVSGEFDGILSQIISGPTAHKAGIVTPSDIEKASYQTAYRSFPKFERQLFAMKRLCDEGELALALVGTMSLVEWLLKSAQGISGKSSISELLHSSNLGLPQEIIVTLDKARLLRNKLAHEEPPDRRELSHASERSETIAFFGKRTGLDFDLVNTVIKQAFSLYRFLNIRGHVTRSG